MIEAGKIEAAIRDGLGASILPLSSDDVVVSGLMAKFAGLDTDCQTVAFAWTMARNFALDTDRHAMGAARNKARDMVRSRNLALAEQEKAAEAETRRLCLAEFARIVELVTPTLRTKQTNCLRVVELTVFDGKTMDDLRERFPGSSDQVLWQWKRRGIDLLLRHASKRMADFLNRARKITPGARHTG